MRVIVQQQNLKKAVHLVDRVVARAAALPILSSIVLKAENGRLHVLATNLEIGITSSVGGKVEIAGEIAVPGRILSDLVNTVPDGNVTLTAKNNNLHIESESYKTNILGSDAKEYPTIPKLKSPLITSIPAQMLKSICMTAIDSIAASETRPELYGLFAQFSESSAVFAATDSFRLVEKKLENKGNATKSMIIPRSTVMELVRVGGEMEGDFDIRVGDNQVSFTNSDVEVVSRLIDGNYPDYSKVIPEKVISRVLVKKTDLEKNIRLAGLFASNIADIKMQCKDNSISIVAKNTDKGDVQAKTAAILKNEPFELALNFNYLLDGLKIIPTEKVVIEFTGNGSPLILRPDSETFKLVYLIMPLRN